MKLDQTLDASEIVSNAQLAQKFMQAAKADVENTQGQQEANKHVRMQVAFQGGALLEANRHTWPTGLMAGTAKLQADIMGAFGAATEPTGEKLYKLERTLDQNFQLVEAQRPAAKVTFNMPKNSL